MKTLTLLRFFVLMGALSVAPHVCLAAKKDQGAEPPKETCADLPTHMPRLGAFGLEHWQDKTLRVATNPREKVKIPTYWVPVGSYRTKSRDDECVLFPDGQSVVLINPLFWQVGRMPVDSVGISVVRFIPKTYDADAVQRLDDLIQSSYKKVSHLFPLGLKTYMHQDHHILVTAGIAGDAFRREQRIAPFPGPHLSVVSWPLESLENRQFLIRQMVYLFNKMRPREETFKDDPLLVAVSWSDMVAGWATLAFIDDAAARRRQVEDFYKIHTALTDEDEDTWPNLRVYKGIDSVRGPFGMPPHHPSSRAAVRYSSTNLGPLIMVALEGMLAEEKADSGLMDYIRLIHAKKVLTLPNVMKATLSADGYQRFAGWLAGQQIEWTYI